MSNNILIDAILNALQNKQASVPRSPVATQGINKASPEVAPPVSIPTPPGAMNFQGITVPGQQPGSLESDQRENAVFEQDQRGGQLPAIIQQILASRSQAQPTAIATPPGAMQVGGLTFPGQKPGSLESDQLENSVFEYDQRGGLSAREFSDKSRKEREENKQEKHPDFPDAFKEDGVWKVTINGKKYRIEE